MDQSSSGKTSPSTGLWRRLGAGVAAGVFALAVVWLSWAGCSGTPGGSAPARQPVDLTAVEPEPGGPPAEVAPVRQHKPAAAPTGVAGDLTAAAPVCPFADETAEPKGLGLPASPPTFAGAPQLPSASGVILSPLEGERAIGDVAAASVPRAAKNPVAGDIIPSIETQVFGVTGRGSRFVYVFDRSFSMDGSPLAAAKRELLTSIARLQRVHQFQIVFYNENPKLMRPAPDQPPQMLFADENGLAAAESFVGSITAAGATDHMQALKLALRMGPDVVFFLTDADEPQLTSAELEAVHRLAGGTTINAIQFQPGPPTSQGGFLRKMAEQNGGQYQYVDVDTLK